MIIKPQKMDLLQEPYKTFIITELAQFTSLQDIYKKLTSETSIKDYNFEPYDGTFMDFHKQVVQIPDEEILQQRDIWLQNTDEVSTSHEKVLLVYLDQTIRTTKDARIRIAAIKASLEVKNKKAEIDAKTKSGITVNVGVSLVKDYFDYVKNRDKNRLKEQNT